jgi:hypothetical protein
VPCSRLGTDIQFRAFHYPLASSAQDRSAIEGFGLTRIDSLAHEIGNDLTHKYVVGHSSGCAIANAIAKRVVELEGTKAKAFCLVVLDGFRRRTYSPKLISLVGRLKTTIQIPQLEFNEG